MLDALELLGAVHLTESHDHEMLTELAGRDDPDPTLVALTSIGLWGVREMLLEQGVPAPLVGELAGEDVEYVCVRLAGARREVAEAELTAWVAARSARAAADELARLLRRTDEPAHRALALYALRRNGERRDSAESGRAGAGRSWRVGGLGPARSPSGHGTRCGPVRLWVSAAANVPMRGGIPIDGVAAAAVFTGGFFAVHLHHLEPVIGRGFGRGGGGGAGGRGFLLLNDSDLGGGSPGLALDFRQRPKLHELPARRSEAHGLFLPAFAETSFLHWFAEVLSVFADVELIIFDQPVIALVLSWQIRDSSTRSCARSSASSAPPTRDARRAQDGRRGRRLSAGNLTPRGMRVEPRMARRARLAGCRPMARFGILTGGGDCPGLNAVIRGVVRAGVNRHGHEIVGFRYGWAGVLEAQHASSSRRRTRRASCTAAARSSAPRGRTRTRTAPTAPRSCARRSRREGIDALIPIGGEDTLGVAGRLSADGVPVVGVPKTIDNDLAGTDVTFGFHTAVQIATDAIDRLHTTAESHNRVIVVEVMGRHAGWIAAYSGIAGGADVILVPERPFDIDEVCERIKRRHARGTTFSIVVVSEGATPRDGSGITTAGGEDRRLRPRAPRRHRASQLEREIEERTGFETRMTILGHVQRGGTPTAYDRVLATRFGVARRSRPSTSGEFGTMVALRGTDIVLAPLGRRGRRAQAARPTISTTRPRSSSASRSSDRPSDPLATLAGCAACGRDSSSSLSRSRPPAAARTPRPRTTTSTRSTGPRASSRRSSTSSRARSPRRARPRRTARRSTASARPSTRPSPTSARSRRPARSSRCTTGSSPRSPPTATQIDKAKGAFSDNDPQAIVKAQADLVSAVTKVQAQINQTIADINKKLRE